MANQKSCDWRNLSAAKRAAREGKLEVASTKRWGKVSINLQRILEKKGSGDHIALKQPYGKPTWLENDSPVPTQNTSSYGGSSIRMLLELYMQFRGQCSTPNQLRSLCSNHCSSIESQKLMFSWEQWYLNYEHVYKVAETPFCVKQS